MVRAGLSDLELSELLARRKKIYEALHPATIARNLPGHTSNYGSSGDKLTGEEKPFSQDAAGQLVQGKIKSVDEYTAEDETTTGEDYYRTGAFIVDTFSGYCSTLGLVPENHKLRLGNYRKMLSSAQLKELIHKAESSVTLLEDYIAFLENELEVSE